MFGDILTDEASVLTGSMGMQPSASLAGLPGVTENAEDAVSLYEPIHGSRSRHRGAGYSQPIGMVLSVAMMLRHSFGLEDEARAVEASVEGVLAEGYRTPDIASDGGEVVGTSRMGTVLAGRV